MADVSLGLGIRKFYAKHITETGRLLGGRSPDNREKRIVFDERQQIIGTAEGILPLNKRHFSMKTIGRLRHITGKIIHYLMLFRQLPFH